MDYDANRPIYLQIIEKIKWDIVLGKILPDEKLLSIKDMALEMSVNPNTVYRVYRELEAEGIAETRRGFGTYVVNDSQMVERLQTEIIDSTIFQSMEALVKLGFSDEKIQQFVGSTLKKIRRNK